MRLTRGNEVFEDKLVIGLDRRAPWKMADRKAQFDAAERIAGTFGDMSDLIAKLDSAAQGAAEKLHKLPAGDPLGPRLKTLAQKIEETRRKIVATKEGGAITGEERIREHLDHLYGAVNGWEGKPAKYQLERLDALKHELSDVDKEFQNIAKSEIKPIGELLKKRHLAPIVIAGGDRDDDGDAEGMTSISAVTCWESRATDCKVEFEADRRR